jgi:hypothetical protein
MTQAAAQTRSAFPQVGQVFELVAQQEITALSLVADFGYNPEGWGRSSAATVAAGTTKRFKLVAVGYQDNLAAVAKACTKPGQKVPEGAWMQVFDDTFGSNGRNPIGVADPSWVDPLGYAFFPMVDGDGYRYFIWAGNFRYDSWLWLVEVSE